MAADGVRAAGSGLGRRARPWGTICGTMVLAAAACGALSAAGALPALGGAYAALSLRLEHQLHTQAPAPPARIALGPHGRDIRFAGEIGEGAADRLAALLAAHPAVTRIHLTSEGGLVAEASAIGDLIAARGLSTYVPDYCVSACTLAFVRGTTRALVTDGRLGFHAPYDPGLFGQVVQADAAVERAAYVAAGVDPSFAAEALGVASDSLWIPDPARLVRARVATELVDTDRFPDSTLDDDPSFAGARAAVLRALPLLEALAGRDEILSALASGYLDGYRAGISEGEALDRLRARAARAIRQVLQGADAATWTELGGLVLRAMRQVGPDAGPEAGRDADPDACLAIGGTGDLLALQDVLSAPSLSPDRPAADAVRTLLARAARQAGPGGREAGPAPAARLPRDCAGLIAAYAEALARPGAGGAVRALASQGVRPAREAAALPR